MDDPPKSPFRNDSSPSGRDGHEEGKDAWSAGSSATGATEDDASRRPAATSPTPWSADDLRFKTLALAEARGAGERGEVPVGAVLMQSGSIVASRGNERELRHDPTAHAEMLVLRDAAAILGGWRVLDATLY
ncbi:MAG: deaminase, partial [Thermoleophilia bacterium]|nr:deaminase [Thermoleophilia bacterium]